MIIFDFDGVISDSLLVCQNACQWAATNQQPNVIVASNPFQDLNPVTFENLAGVLGLDEEPFVADVIEYVTVNSKQADIFAGMANSIQDLAKHYDLYIVSASHSCVVREKLKRYQLSQHFNAILGGDHAGSKTVKIGNLQREHNKTAVMVGDSISDIDAANTNGAYSIAVTWGWQSESRLRQSSPSYVATNPNQLVSVISNLLR